MPMGLRVVAVYGITFRPCNRNQWHSLRRKGDNN